MVAVLVDVHMRVYSFEQLDLMCFSMEENLASFGVSAVGVF